MGTLQNKDFSIRTCKNCSIEYMPTSCNQKYCKRCGQYKGYRGKAVYVRLRRYDITQATYEQFVLKRNGLCHLCDEQGIQIDHCHSTGEARGLLCTACNFKLVGLEDHAWLQKADAYLIVPRSNTKRFSFTSLDVDKVACQKCGSCFQRNKGPQRRWCKECAPTAAAYMRLNRYFVSQAEYEALILKQEGYCILCPEPATRIDHCHETGAVRGMLCAGCNWKLAGLDDKGWRARAEVYLSKESI